MKYFYSEVDRDAIYLFHQGRNFKSQELLGAHFKEEYTSFSLWAPNAEKVMLIGDFNDWNEENLPMKKFPDSNIWNICVEDVKNFHSYKYLIISKNGEKLYKADPFAFHSETRPGTASKVYDIKGFSWKDEDWFSKKNSEDIYSLPINIYEVNFLSWKKHQDQNPYNYVDLKDNLIPYIKEMGYTHVEIMPIMEHPFDGSWGYQITGYFAPTSRYGAPKDFMDFINECHKNNIGVILDWVPCHFCNDDFGLKRFDGSCLFESEDFEKSENFLWGTTNFDYSKGEVISFLISNVLFWHDYYHIDGLRVDAVTHMIYKNFGLMDVDLNNKDNINVDAINFIQTLNKEIFSRYEKTLMIAEESAAYPLVTKPVHEGGLGFNYKWNMGWMNDILKYFETDPIYRKYHQNTLTFPITYAFSENYILPLSHDEVVHGKKSLLEKMMGSYEDKFQGLRLLLSYMIAHPGKKLTFMGTELAQFIEWNEERELDWLLLAYEKHKELKNMVKELNHIYIEESCLHEIDHDYSGFNWIEHENHNESIIAFERVDKKGDKIICIFNFVPVERKSYPIGVSLKGKYTEIFSTNLCDYGGEEVELKEYISNDDFQIHARENYIRVDIPKMGGVFIKLCREE